MKHAFKPFYYQKYRFELAMEITGRTKRGIQAYMRRKKLTLAGAIKGYLK